MRAVFEIGASLAAARQSRGLELADAERLTCLRTRYLIAFEQDRFADLPGHVYGLLPDHDPAAESEPRWRLAVGRERQIQVEGLSQSLEVVVAVHVLRGNEIGVGFRRSAGVSQALACSRPLQGTVRGATPAARRSRTFRARSGALRREARTVHAVSARHWKRPL